MNDVVRHKSDLSDLHVFHAVAVCGSINAAARALRVDPSTVSRALEQVEARLNARLVRRTSQGVILTKAGEIALARVRTIEHLVGELEREILDSEALAPIGAVTLACPDGIGTYVLTPKLPRLLRENPKLDIRLDCGLWPENPLESDAEISLGFNREPAAGYVSRPLAYFHYGLFGSKSFVELYGMPKSLEEAVSHPFLHHSAQVQTRAMERRIPAFQNIARRRIETNSSAALVEGVLAGAGLAALPTYLVPIYPELVLIEGGAAPITLTMTYHRDVERIPRIGAVINWLETVFDQATQPWFRKEYVAPADFFKNQSDARSEANRDVGKNACSPSAELRAPRQSKDIVGA